jgi:hypothetical protein
VCHIACVLMATARKGLRRGHREDWHGRVEMHVAVDAPEQALPRTTTPSRAEHQQVVAAAFELIHDVATLVPAMNDDVDGKIVGERRDCVSEDPAGPLVQFLPHGVRAPACERDVGGDGWRDCDERQE